MNFCATHRKARFRSAPLGFRRRRCGFVGTVRKNHDQHLGARSLRASDLVRDHRIEVRAITSLKDLLAPYKA